MSIQTFKEKVRGFVSRITTDKKKHLAAGFAICAIVSLLFGYVIGLIAATIAGAEKEARDYITKKGTPEFADFAYTVVGAFMFLAFSVVLLCWCKPSLCWFTFKFGFAESII